VKPHPQMGHVFAYAHVHELEFSFCRTKLIHENSEN